MTWPPNSGNYFSEFSILKNSSQVATAIESGQWLDLGAISEKMDHF
jgi:hypothetical protein